jgi:hypothetical protein
MSRPHRRSPADRAAPADAADKITPAPPPAEAPAESPLAPPEAAPRAGPGLRSGWLVVVVLWTCAFLLLFLSEVGGFLVRVVRGLF